MPKSNLSQNANNRSEQVFCLQYSTFFGKIKCFSQKTEKMFDFYAVHSKKDAVFLFCMQYSISIGLKNGQWWDTNEKIRFAADFFSIFQLLDCHLL